VALCKFERKNNKEIRAFILLFITLDNEWQDKNLTELDPGEEGLEEEKKFWNHLGANVPEYLLQGGKRIKE